jgi:PAP2 superfamily C-terminal
MVPYGAASDFYYSGHTGFFVLLIREELILPDKNPKLVVALCLALSYMVTIILLYKVHYTIDIPIGVVAAWTCHTLAERYSKNIEAILLPFTPLSWRVQVEENSDMDRHERAGTFL